MPVSQRTAARIYYESQGDAGGSPVLLLHGLACQLVQWPARWLEGIALAGHRIVRIDNRDVGLSEKLDALGTVNIMEMALALNAGGAPEPPYRLLEMADDAIGVLDELGIARAHVVGVSMGGMIAQHLAIRHPQRLLSLTSIMSSSGARDLPPPDAAAITSIMSVPASPARADVIAHLQRSWDLIGGPHYRSTEVGCGRLVAAAVERGRHPPGILRQMAAVLTDTARADALARIRTPTLVIHGDVDPLVPLACGADTARRIPGARFIRMTNMGHDLPDPLIPQILAEMTTHWRAASGGPKSGTG